MSIVQVPSPNFGKRPEGGSPSMLVLHYTGMKTAQAALERLCDPEAQVSAHYMVDECGKVFQLVPEEKRAWHAGVSYWGGERDINSHSIGIEIVNPGHEFGYRPFPCIQIESVKRLSLVLLERYKISPYHVVAHSDIAPERKADPGELFPWKELAQHGIGVWPDVKERDLEAGEDLLAHSLEGYHELLRLWGYDPVASLESVVTAFHRHFYPEKFSSGSDFSKPDKESVARILALLRVRNNLIS